MISPVSQNLLSNFPIKFYSFKIWSLLSAKVFASFSKKFYCMKIASSSSRTSQFSTKQRKNRDNLANKRYGEAY